MIKKLTYILLAVALLHTFVAGAMAAPLNKDAVAVTDSGSYDYNGEIEWGEVAAYLQDTMTYMARRHYGRDQTAQIRQATK